VNNKILAWLIYSLLAILPISAQSIEVMPGTYALFTDVQFFEPIVPNYRLSLFSRTRMALNYDNETDFFSAAYANYTSPAKIGVSLVGSVNNGGGDFDIGPHYSVQSEKFSLFALASITLTKDANYSWFSIAKFHPQLSGNWKGYISIELFSVFGSAGHLASIQRIRLGLDSGPIQFGLATNLRELGKDLVFTNNNYGLFVRRVW